MPSCRSFLCSFFFPIYLILDSFPVPSFARKFNNTGTGTIALEEAWTIPELLFQNANVAAPLGKYQVLDVSTVSTSHDYYQRLADMDANGVDFMVISCASPCIQGISDPTEAANMARTVNDRLAATIANNTMRFGGFASLAMHDPAVAVAEFKRTVQDYGFVGALLNDYQQSGADNATLLYYDQPEYDVFWQAALDLDLPVYLHPRVPISQVVQLEYAHSPWLIGPAQEFTVTLSNHIMGITANGVFDRFPKLKLIVGHLGERIPSDFLRINEQLSRQLPLGMPMLKNASDYWKTNIFETTSGNFATPLLKFHSSMIGIDRILFSVDYPYVSIAEGAEWFAGLSEPGGIGAEDMRKVGRETAIEILGLNK